MPSWCYDNTIDRVSGKNHLYALLRLSLLRARLAPLRTLPGVPAGSHRNFDVFSFKSNWDHNVDSCIIATLRTLPRVHAGSL